MKEKILKFILILALVTVLVASDFILLGHGIAIAIYEELETQSTTTNVKNVEFDSYFLDNGNKTHSKQNNLTQEEILVLNINVKEQGVLNDAKIKIENANFETQKEKIQNTYVKNINLETNEIELNQIIYGNNVTIELPIKFKKQTSFEEDYFEKENTITLTGTYVEGETQSSNVTGQIKTRMIWTEEVDVGLTQEVEKYINLGTEGVLLQNKIITEVTNNLLPRKTETIETTAPILEGVQAEGVVVIKNGEKLLEDKVTYDKENQKVTITEDTSGIWKDSKNEYKVIYNYKNIEFKPQDIEITTNMTTNVYTKGTIQKTDTKVITLEEKGNSVSIFKTATQKIYKGYMYANATNGTEYKESNNIEISEINTVEGIEIGKGNEVYEDANGKQYTVGNSLIYESSMLYKNELEKIFGQDYVITITDNGGNVLHTITKETEDENGVITVEYNENISEIKIKITKPVSEGTIHIDNKRSIQGNSGYEKNSLKEFTTLRTQTKVITNKAKNITEEIAESTTTLEDTRTEAQIEINNNNLSTIQPNENVQLLLTLKSDSEEYDLYKNPIVEIILPKELSIEVTKTAQLNGQEEINIVNMYKYINNEGKEVIRIELQGEQISFVNGINEGIQIAITANINIDKMTPTKVEQIKMNYTNENRGGETFESFTEIQLNSKYGVLMLNKLSGYNQNDEMIENIDDKEKTANLEINADAKVATQELYVLNNYDTSISNISIIGQIPAEDDKESTFQMNLTEPIQVEGKSAKIYYSVEQTEDVNAQTWVENVEDISTVRSYKIEVQESTMEKGEVLKILYNVQIPGQLVSKDTSYLKTDLSYQYLGNEEKTSQLIKLKTTSGADTQEETNIGENQEESAEPLSVKISATTDNTEMEAGQTVYVGEAIQYKVTVNNNTDFDMTNVKIVATHDNAIFYGEVNELYEDDTDEEGKPVYRTFIKENPDLTNEEFTVDTLKQGESQTFIYQISVADVEANQKLTGNIEVTADNQATKNIVIPESEITESDIKATLVSDWPDNIKISSNSNLPIDLNIENKTQNVLQDVVIDFQLPEEVYFEYNGAYFIVQDDENYELIDYGSDFLKVRIKELMPNEEKTETIFVNLITKSMDTSINQVDTELIYSATVNNRTYYSNKMYKTIYQSETAVTANQTSNIEGEYVKDNDELIFTFNVSNIGIIDAGLTLEDTIPDGLIVQESYIMNSGTRIDLGTTNVNGYHITLAAGTTAVWTIVTKVDASLINASTITNYATITGNNINIKTNEITYKVRGNEHLNPGGSDDGVYSISGVAWQDINRNGVKESTDKRLATIPVYLINIDTNSIVENGSTTTNDNGEYKFSDIKAGKYVVVFQYDNSKYRVTEYQKDGVSELTNSDVVDRTKTINGRTQKVAITENLSLNQNLSNIDAGFIELEKFDLKLDKYISRIIIQTGKQTSVREYNQEKLAKVELDAKAIANSTVIVEYKILVKNEGEVAGYASEIVDYMPSDLIFHSEMNTNWFLSTDQNLYSRELANQIINPGETKEITLTLYKTMNGNNTGTTVNTAEIGVANNDSDIADIDSTPGNKVTGEDDMDRANVIISIRTGGAIELTILVIICMTIIVISVYMIKTKVLNDIK